jgi:hypothetical protein
MQEDIRWHQPITPDDYFPPRRESKLLPIPESATDSGDSDGRDAVSADELLHHIRLSSFYEKTLEDLIAEFARRRSLQFAVWLLSFTPWRLWIRNSVSHLLMGSGWGPRYSLRRRTKVAKEKSLIELYRADVTTDIRKARKTTRPNTDPLGRPLRKPSATSIIDTMPKKWTKY